LQIPGGWLADRYGGKSLVGGTVLLSSFITLMSPVAARVHLGVFLLLRILLGLVAGFLFPAIHTLIARWSAPKNRSLVVSTIYLGVGAGIVVAMTLSGMLCDQRRFAGGWPSVFYAFGAFGCLWSAVWSLLVHDSPSTHPRMSSAEREYWETAVGRGADAVDRSQRLPWRRLLASAPVWALATAFAANAWGFTTLASCVPMFMHDVLGFDMTKNGLLSAVPFSAAVLLIPVGWFADRLRSPPCRMSTNVVRKLFLAAGFVLTGGLLALAGYAGCDRFLAVALMFLAVASTSLSFSVVSVNQLDLSPPHAGKIMGLTNAVACLAQIAAPHVVGAMTYHRSTRSEWQHVFFLAAGVYAFGTVVFVVFGSGNRLKWQNRLNVNE